MDADDTIEPNYMEQLSGHDEDFVFIDVDQTDGEGNVVGIGYMSKYKNLSKDELLQSQMTGRMPWGDKKEC